eukprot:3762496-Pyramimonas_sp.AAC.1
MSPSWCRSISHARAAVVSGPVGEDGPGIISPDHVDLGEGRVIMPDRTLMVQARMQPIVHDLQDIILNEAVHVV